jgi:hypothetical protein
VAFQTKASGDARPRHAVGSRPPCSHRTSHTSSLTAPGRSTKPFSTITRAYKHHWLIFQRAERQQRGQDVQLSTLNRGSSRILLRRQGAQQWLACNRQPAEQSPEHTCTEAVVSETRKAPHPTFQRRGSGSAVANGQREAVEQTWAPFDRQAASLNAFDSPIPRLPHDWSRRWPGRTKCQSMSCPATADVRQTPGLSRDRHEPPLQTHPTTHHYGMKYQSAITEAQQKACRDMKLIPNSPTWNCNSCPGPDSR